MFGQTITSGVTIEGKDLVINITIIFSYQSNLVPTISKLSASFHADFNKQGSEDPFKYRISDDSEASEEGHYPVRVAIMGKTFLNDTSLCARGYF